MLKQAHVDTHEDSDQEALAASLIDCLGRDGAIHAAKVNGWLGVLAVIEESPSGRPAQSFS